MIRQSELSRQQARHDALTGLPNRVSFAECVEQAIRSARRRKERIAVLMLDLDRFEEDQPVRSATRRATRCCGGVARPGCSGSPCATPTRSRS